MIDVPRLGYQARLDGMRAVAILMVMGVHSWRPFAGGVLGVDVFFALSGFLITTLVVEEMRSHEGRLNFRYFYARRSLRLFPALYVMLAVVGVYVIVRWQHLPEMMVRTGAERSQLGRAFAASATYTGNIFDVDGTPLGHTWSLAVEEQYYLLWPAILLLAVRRNGLKLLGWFTVAVAVAAFALRILDVEAMVRPLGNRLDTIGLGSGAAIARMMCPRLRAVVVRYASILAPLSLGAFVVLALSVGFVFDNDILPKGGFSLAAVIATVLVWSVAEDTDGPLSRLFALPALVQVGMLSYSLYIWHQPIFRIMAWELPDLSTKVLIPLEWAVAIAISVVGYRLVEQPARRLQQRFRVGTPAASR